MPSKTWFACHQPERPTDAYVMWHYDGCLGCAIKADATVRQHPDDPIVQRILGSVAHVREAM